MRRIVPVAVFVAVGLVAAPVQALAGWKVVQNPSPGQLAATVVTSPAEAWASGFTWANNRYRALTEHFTGGAWAVAPSAAVSASDTTFLYGLASTGPGDVWAVGSDMNSSSSVTQGLIEHWNGRGWTRSASVGEPAGSTLVAVSTDGPSDAWAVGYSRNPSTAWFSPLIEHWNGTGWKVAAGAAAYPGGPYNRLETVAAITPSDVWALGVTGRHPSPVFEHFNGTSWSIVPQPASGYDTFLDAVSARASNDIWAVGGTNVTDTLVEHWNGATWSIVPSPNVTGQGSVLNTLTGVTALAANDVWAVGSTLTGGATRATLAEHWNGTSWSITPTPSPPPSASLNAVSGLPGGPVFAAGSLILEH